ncbi:protein of unknown function [Pseudomonas cuatrocienegasensis]|uniref:DUF1911 domain-containing protein n=1 Tax=Pseudomonas cuatrocienegasensis TaxID=543360 RepID=A0ABY1BS09_9PSED|nr:MULTISPECIES: PoNe immunity protein domain-containing protein [Pseudomonas]OEC32525.1 hypothetical protein A7D25_23720 [Pseudomonas sp. 21C1]SER49983.1 protein of unknown function [Pseudomonas cuatrocienegasensis]
MIRAPIGEVTYWDKWVEHSEGRTKKMLAALGQPRKTPVYDPQYSFDAAFEHLRLIFERYSRGDPIRELDQHFSGLLDAWELSNRLSDEICAEHNLKTCRDWTFELPNLNHYNWCFWLVGLALALEVPDEQWQRLLALIGGEGEDVLLDRVIASRQTGRVIGRRVLHPKPYARLLQAVDVSQDQQAFLLHDFVEHWYTELARKGKEELWWYIYGDSEKHPLEKGSYFGRWCIEAIAVVKAFGLDDSLCLGHEHYPGDLLRPNGPSTHLIRRAPKSGWFAKFFGR